MATRTVTRARLATGGPAARRTRNQHSASECDDFRPADVTVRNRNPSTGAHPECPPRAYHASGLCQGGSVEFPQRAAERQRGYDATAKHSRFDGCAGSAEWYGCDGWSPESGSERSAASTGIFGAHEDSAGLEPSASLQKVHPIPAGCESERRGPCRNRAATRSPACRPADNCAPTAACSAPCAGTGCRRRSRRLTS